MVAARRWRSRQTCVSWPMLMTPEEAKDYGIIDEVLVSKVRIPSVARPELMVG